MNKTSRAKLVTGFAVCALTIVTAGCSEPAVSGSDQPGTQGRSSVAPGPAGAAQRVAVAESSIPDLAAALGANGVDDPEGWAKIVKQSGPYPAGDAGALRLRQVLARFRVDPGNAARITNALVP